MGWDAYCCVLYLSTPLLLTANHNLYSTFVPLNFAWFCVESEAFTGTLNHVAL